jgi:tRNA threonylcarbamoyladenosine biosynthesis protein TsaE
MNNQPILLTSEAQTQQIARHIADLAEVGDVIYLQGTLGMGKSVLARAFIQHLAGCKIEIPSPTFTLVQTYDSLKKPVWHLDLYRLTTPDEVYELGLDEALASAITLIEWPERLGTISFANTLRVTLSQGPNENGRLLHYVPQGRWAAKLTEGGMQEGAPPLKADS